jgi:predicted GH43/DUF377 family glycosyl hydrolase
MKLINTIIFFLLFTSFLNSQTEWFKYPGNPVLRPGPLEWDLNNVGFSSVINDQGIYKMWYTGGRSTFSDVHIGYATSLDGINWEKYSGNPVLSPTSGTFDAGGLGTCAVIFDEGMYKMWYLGFPTNADDNWRIGYATSPDGINWTKQNQNNPVLDIGAAGEWDDHKVGHPAVIKDGSVYKMWFHGGRQPGAQGSIGYATSTDGINWTKYDDPSTTNPPYAESDPVLNGDSGMWDETVVQQPNVILNNSLFEMWYAGNIGSTQSIGYATSSDGIEWAKHPSPVLTETSFLLAPWVIYSNQVYRMWYTGLGVGNLWRINFAASDPDVVSVELENFSAIAFSLNQNYPNPFNPGTTISWQSPVGSHQTLKVYDLMGKEVATLVNEYKPAGYYEVEWDASDLSSGVYFYKLQTDGFTQTKKLLLMK